MRSLVSADFLICSIVVFMTLTALSNAEMEQTKNRRGGSSSSGLFAFPRVGRSDPSLSNSLHDATDSVAFDGLYPVSLEDYDEYSKNDDIKRANMMSFPRVGRNDAKMQKWARLLALQQAFEKRTGPSTTSGLWFGPRLGKRSIDANEQRQQQEQKHHY